MRRWLAVIFVLAATAGCRRSVKSSGPLADSADQVGVVDLNQVAQTLGWHDEMVKMVTDLDHSLSAQIDQASRQYDAEVKKVRAGFSTQPSAKLTPAQQETLSTMLNSAQRIISQMRVDQNKELEEYREQCLVHYRDAITPIVSQLAKSRNIGVVLTPTDMVLFNDPSVDLTAAVAAAAQAHPPAVSPVTPPTLPPAPALIIPDLADTTPATRP